ncbi:MAG: transcriptional regulator NrdR [Candidatus Berkelbacteria bacterium]|nr:transcriptional regulator NrdR [Candidatus Berkelbacteria bacterium]
MLCPECKKSDTKVLDSRDDNRLIRRRRECLRCKYRFTTYEKIEPPKIKVIKRTGLGQDYSREKLSRGIYLACEKRPLSINQIEQIIDSIEHDITKLKTRFITSKQIGKFAIDHLKISDEVAYLRFLSVYKSFSSASKFQKEAEKLTRKDFI